MSPKLKPVSDQVIVITGATSGIGLATARMAAARGARVVLVARNEHDLIQLESELREQQHVAIHVAADVGEESLVKHVADVTIEHFGGFDTWINNAGSSIFGRLVDVQTSDHRRLFETNFWGIVYGSLAAARHFQARKAPGAIINLGSILSDQAIPEQGMYCASKFAVKGFTDALRMELNEAQLPVSVTLVKPGSIGTPFSQRARNYMTEEPRVPPPVYAPDAVAKAIIHCCEVPVRSIYVGGAAKSIAMLGHYLPSVADKLLGHYMPAAQRRRMAAQRPTGTLHAPTSSLQERSAFPDTQLESSLYTYLTLHGRDILAGVGVGLAASILLGLQWNSRHS